MARVYRDFRRHPGIGQTFWRIDYVDATGVRRRVRTPATTKELAQKILRKKLDEVELAKIHGLPAIEQMVFNDFMPEYLNHVKAVRAQTSQVRVQSFVKVLGRTFGTRILSKIRSGDVQRWVDARSQEKKRGGKTIKPATVVSEFVCLSAIFREAKKRSYVYDNPCRGVTLPRVNNKITRCLTDEQEKRLLAACSECFRPIVVTALFSGMRLGEILDLRWGDVDLDTGILTVVHGKGEKMRHIPMVPELKEALGAIDRTVSADGAASPWIFNNPETGTRWVDTKKQWARALRISGIREFRFHDLRHTFASRLVQRGVPLKAVQELLGHADIKMTMRYAHLAQSDLRDAVSVLSSGGQAELTPMRATKAPPKWNTA
jgi:integrase